MLPDFFKDLPAEKHVPGVTVYWWTGKGWQSHRFVRDYRPAIPAVRIAHGTREHVVKPEEIISRERYLEFKAHEAR